MATFRTKIETPWDAERSFAYLSDITNFVEWDPGTTSAVQVAGDGPAVGAEYDLHAGSADLRYRVTELQPHERFAAVGENGWVRSQDAMTVQPAAQGSVITYEAELHPKGLARLGGPIWQLVFDRMGEKAADGLAAATDGRRLA